MKNRLTKNQAIFCMAAYVVFYALLTACCLLLFVRKSDEEFLVTIRRTEQKILQLKEKLKK